MAGRARLTGYRCATVTLTPGSGAAGQSLPADMRAVEGPAVDERRAGVDRRAALPAEAAIGSPLRLGLLWRASATRPGVAQLKVRLVRASGEVVQDIALPLLGGRLSPSTLHAGNVVRDEQSLVVDARAPAEPVAVEVALDDSESCVRLGTASR